MLFFTKDQLVWAKVKRQAWWPALVVRDVSIKDKDKDAQIEISFVGEDKQATVLRDQIADFQEKFTDFSKNKNKKLQEAIKIALEIQKKSENMPNKQTKIQPEKNVQIVTQNSQEEVPQKKPRGRPKKNSDKNQPFGNGAGIRLQKDIKDQVLVSIEIEDDDGPSEERISSSKLKRDEKIEVKSEHSGPERVTRSKIKSGNAQLIVESLPVTARKGKKGTAVKEKKGAPIQMIAEESKSKEPKESKKSNELKGPTQEKSVPVVENDFKIPLTKHQQLSISMEKPQERNLLKSIRAEPSTCSHIEVTTRKRRQQSIMNTAVSHQVNNSNKRSSCMWFKDVPPSVYLTHAKAKHHRSFETDYIVKKIKISPSFQEKMSSVKATKLKDLQVDRNWVSKARVAYNSLMIRKFENDLEQILCILVKKFKKKEVMHETDGEHKKLLNIITEFEKNKFNGSEFISSDVGKLIKTLHRLLINNRPLLNGVGNMLLAMTAKILHRVKDNIIRFCLDNTDYVETFGVNEVVERPSAALDVIEIDPSDIKFEEFSFDKASKVLVVEDDINALSQKDNLIEDKIIFQNYDEKNQNKPVFLQFGSEKPLYYENQDEIQRFNEIPTSNNQDKSQVGNSMNTQLELSLRGNPENSIFFYGNSNML